MTNAATSEIIAALSRLNGHARAWGFGKKAIYAYKTFVACALATDARPVRVQAKCHHCSGTGTYRDWDGYDRGTCYRCTNGVVTLRFIESAVGECRWHHPTKDGGLDVLCCAWDITSITYPDGHDIATLRDGTERPIVYEQAEGWGPNMPGAERLPADEACRLLNVVERELPNIRTAGRNMSIRWPREQALREIARYQITLDLDSETCCCVCGTADTYSRCGGLSRLYRHGFTHFSRMMCATCHGVSAPYRWPAEPDSALLTPNVLAWLDHPERQRQRVVEQTYDY